MSDGIRNIDKGNTEIIAEMIKDIVNADLFKVEPLNEYPYGYNECCEVAKEELKNNERPKIKKKLDNINDYEVIYIGFPIWWSDLPQILYTFLESYDFTGKNVYLFSPNGGSGLASTVSTITNKLDGANVNQNAFKLYRENMEDAPEEVEKWLEQVGVIK